MAYTWNEITSDLIVNYFLYGQATTPSNLVDATLIRPTGDKYKIELDMVSFMAEGAGRFVNPAVCPLVNEFFDSVWLKGNGERQEWTVEQLEALLGQPSTFGIQQYLYAGDDIAMRTFIFNSSGFRLSRDAKFVIEADGTKKIINCAIHASQDNFDFESSSFLAKLFNPSLLEVIDPSHIGRMVTLSFTNKEAVPVTPDYRLQDLHADMNAVAGPSIPGLGVYDGVQQILQDLWDSGVIKFLDEQQRPILYGRFEGGAVSADMLSSHRFLKDYLGNGVVMVGADAADKLTGTSNDDILAGGGQGDVLDAGAGDDELYGQGGNDTFIGGPGSDYIYGGESSESVYDGIEADIVSYADNSGAISVDAQAGTVTDMATGDADKLYSIEAIIGTKQNDVFKGDLTGTLDGGGGIDSLDYGTLGKKLIIGSDASGRLTVVEGSRKDIAGNFERLKLGNTDDKVVIGSNTGLQEIDLGGGNNIIGSTAQGIRILAGAGDDIIIAQGSGTIIETGAGNDKISIGDNILITDADENDRIYFAGMRITGGLRWKGSESAWASGKSGLKYGKNQQGELVIQDALGRQTFISNYVGGPGVTANTAGIYIAEVSLSAYKLLSPDLPNVDWLSSQFALGDALAKANTGKSMFGGVDPLVLDLDGDGIELSAQSSVAPMFDIDGDGFAERTGWVQSDDALLVRDDNGNGKIDDVRELFGGVGGQSGFAELAMHDATTTDASTRRMPSSAN